MAVENLAEAINSAPEDRESVREFIEFLSRRNQSPFLTAVDEFIGTHPDLLSRLAR
jgi:hypothetical protein